VAERKNVRYGILGLVALGLLATASPAFADPASFTLDGHRFHFDIPPGFVEDTSSSDSSRISFKPTRFGALLVFSVHYATTQEEFDRLKDNPRFQSRYLFDGRVGYHAAINDHSLFGSVFASSCSGKCIVNISVAGSEANQWRLPFDPVEAQALLETYARVLAGGDFGGE
jgi:hypothetical protein